MSFIRKNYLFLTIFSLGFLALKAPIPTLTEFLVNNGLLEPLSVEQKTELSGLGPDAFEFNLFGDSPFHAIKNGLIITEKEPSQASIDDWIASYQASHPKPTQANIDVWITNYRARIEANIDEQYRNPRNLSKGELDDWALQYRTRTYTASGMDAQLRAHAVERLNSYYRDGCVQSLKADFADSERSSTLDRLSCLGKLRGALTRDIGNCIDGLSRLDREVAKKILTGKKIAFFELVQQSAQNSSFKHYVLLKSLYQEFVNAKISKKILTLSDIELEGFFDFIPSSETQTAYLHFMVMGQDEILSIKSKIALYRLKPDSIKKFIDESPELQTVNPSEFREFLFRGLEKEMNVWIKAKLVTPPANGFSSAGFRGNSQAHVVDLCSAVLKEKYRERAKFTAAITFFLGMTGFASSFLIKKLERKNPNTKKVKHRKLLINGLWFGGLAIVGGAGIFYYLYLNHHRELLKIWSSFKQGVPFSRLWPYVLYV